MGKREDINQKLFDLGLHGTLLDGYEEAIVGYLTADMTPFEYLYPEEILTDEAKKEYDELTNTWAHVLYDRDKCIDVLMTRDGMSHEEALDFFEYNTVGSLATAPDPKPIIIEGI